MGLLPVRNGLGCAQSHLSEVAETLGTILPDLRREAVLLGRDLQTVR